MNDLRASVSETLNWRSAVRRHPVVALCGAALAGVLLAKLTTR